ncbi:hypothetical protein L3Y34_012054 [Caenorhabditis briggsae]|uniref:Uncharacterized protein n=1 Tax=Caenorhabditis briggsae TaxID=6238 RepID=A0AAE9CUQ6_CAEBR|nr:hypothetical protein L3Y34_012054 [Caenorhabditis briggsae]
MSNEFCRKGTSTRRSRADDNVVEMQKSITDMVQKQVEKEKSLKRKERSMLKSSVPRETSEVSTSAEIKTEELDLNSEILKIPIPEPSEIYKTFLESVPRSESLANVKMEIQDTPSGPEETKKKKEIAKETSSRDSTPSVNGATNVNEMAFVKPTVTTPTKTNIQVSTPQPQKIEIQENPVQLPPQLQPHQLPLQLPVSAPIPNFHIGAEMKIPQPPAPHPSWNTIPAIVPPPQTMASVEAGLLQEFPERILKNLNQSAVFDQSIGNSQKSGTNSEPAAVVIPNGWDREKIIKELASSLGPNHTMSPTTSRQSSETDSSSSDGNRSFETPLIDVSPSVSKCCQIPDYMIHRDTPQKIVIVANGFPAYFEEFPRRIH